VLEDIGKMQQKYDAVRMVKDRISFIEIATEFNTLFVANFSVIAHVQARSLIDITHP